ncbi:MAG TPA: hypothetical protein PLA50_08045 [Bacteroidia bacterium]|nr:hypothetical protein [Bacteroidia bacterium]
MWLELPPVWIVVLNCLAVPAIHLGVSWFFTRLDAARFRPESPLWRERRWERGGDIYQRLFRIRAWKRFLPDAAPWFDGFAKGRLRDKDPAYLRAFVVETCRGEAAHLAQIPALCLVLIWNPWPAAAIAMLIYAVVSNLPCLILQRFTRARLRKAVAEKR